MNRSTYYRWNAVVALSLGIFVLLGCVTRRDSQTPETVSTVDASVTTEPNVPISVVYNWFPDEYDIPDTWVFQGDHLYSYSDVAKNYSDTEEFKQLWNTWGAYGGAYRQYGYVAKDCYEDFPGIRGATYLAMVNRDIKGASAMFIWWKDWWKGRYASIGKEANTKYIEDVVVGDESLVAFYSELDDCPQAKFSRYVTIHFRKYNVIALVRVLARDDKLTDDDLYKEALRYAKIMEKNIALAVR